MFYTKKKLQMIKTRSKNLSPNLLTETLPNLKPEPIRFLDRFVPKAKKTITIAEEIYQQADNKFYEMHSEDTFSSVSSFDKKASTPKNQQILNRAENELLPRAKSCIKKTIMTFEVNEKFIISSSFHKKTNKKGINKCITIDSIINACKNNGKDDLSSENLKKSIGKDRKLAVRYAKDIE